MADFSFNTLNSLVAYGSTNGLTTTANDPGFSISSSVGTKSIGDFDFSNNQNTSPGYLTGRRPQKGQVFPRGIYNK